MNIKHLIPNDLLQVDLSNKVTINFAPSTELEEIIQNVRSLLRTIKYSVPLGRDIGIDASFIDERIPMAKAKMISEVVNVLKKYEPRVEVVKIDFINVPNTLNIDGNTDIMQGVLHPVITLKLSVNLDKKGIIR